MLKHLINHPPRIAVLGTYLALYDTAFPGYRSQVLEIAEKTLAPLKPDIQVAMLGIGTSPEETAAFLGEAERAGVDAVLIMSLGYTNSLSVAQPLIETSLPLVFFNTQVTEEVTPSFNDKDLLHNHGMQGVQDITCVLVRAGRSFGIVTGLISQEDTRAQLTDELIAWRAYHQIHRSHVALLGDPMPGMGDSMFDWDEARKVFGMQAHSLSPALLAEASREVPAWELEVAREQDLQHFDIDPELTKEDHLRSLRLEAGLRRIVEERSLAGLTLSFDTIARHPGIETIPFLGIIKLMAEGMAYGGEGDLFVTAAGAMAGRLCGDVTFTEMYTMDFKNNAVLNSHMAECNWKMARKDRKPRLVRRQFSLAESAPFAFLHFALEPGEITLSDLTTTSEGRFHFITMECRVADFPATLGLDRPNFKISFVRDIREVVTEYSRLGGSHHLNLVYGHHARRFRLLAEHFGCVYTHIDTGSAG